MCCSSIGQQGWFRIHALGFVWVLGVRPLHSISLVNVSPSPLLVNEVLLGRALLFLYYHIIRVYYSSCTLRAPMAHAY